MKLKQASICLMMKRIGSFYVTPFHCVNVIQVILSDCFLWSENRQHSSTNHGLCCFTSYRPTLCLAEVLIFSLMSSQDLFMSSLLLKFSTAANLTENSIWYCSLTSNSLSFLRLNISTSNFCASCLLTANLSLLLKPPDSNEYHTQLPWKIVHGYNSINNQLDATIAIY